MKIKKINMNVRVVECPVCHNQAKRHSPGQRTVADLGSATERWLHIDYSKHYCTTCRKTFSVDMTKYVLPGRRFSERVRLKALDMMKEHTLDSTHKILLEHHHVDVPPTTLCDWRKAAREEEDAAAAKDAAAGGRRELVGV